MSGEKVSKEQEKLERARNRWLKNTKALCSNAEKIYFTTHALTQFVERSLKNTYRNTPLVEIPSELLTRPAVLARNILAASREEKSNGHHVKRIIKHGFVETSYFVSLCGWRFVIVKENNAERVVTIERVKPEEN
ncbi:MAG: hypothetical protein AAB897_02550 [Patescibacteria group bacterium]